MEEKGIKKMQRTKEKKKKYTYPLNVAGEVHCNGEEFSS
jgi:hypothetical protein